MCWLQLDYWLLVVGRLKPAFGSFFIYEPLDPQHLRCCISLPQQPSSLMTMSQSFSTKQAPPWTTNRLRFSFSEKRLRALERVRTRGTHQPSHSPPCVSPRKTVSGQRPNEERNATNARLPSFHVFSALQAGRCVCERRRRAVPSLSVRPWLLLSPRQHFRSSSPVWVRRVLLPPRFRVSYASGCWVLHLCRRLNRRGLG